jgi:hypothetical protein
MQTGSLRKAFSPVRKSALELLSEVVRSVDRQALPRIRKLYTYYSIEPDGVRFSNRPPQGLRSRAWGRIPKKSELTEEQREAIAQRVNEFVANYRVQPQRLGRLRRFLMDACIGYATGYALLPGVALVVDTIMNFPDKRLDARLNQRIQELDREQNTVLHQNLPTEERQTKYDQLQIEKEGAQEQQRRLNERIRGRQATKQQAAKVWYYQSKATAGLPLGPTALAFAGTVRGQIGYKPKIIVPKQKRARKRH